MSEDAAVPPSQERPVGAPCWIDLTTHDIDGAREFYGELFSWSFEETGPDTGGYVLAKRRESIAAGMMSAMNEDGTPADPDAQPATWTVYLRTDDAQAAADAVVAAGGRTLVPPMEVPGSGIMAVFTDPSGVVFGLWQAGLFSGFDTPLEPGTPVWFEVVTRDFDGSSAFASAALGWELEEMPGSAESGFRYSTFMHDQQAWAGVCDASGFLPEAWPGYWRPYLSVDDCDRAARRVVELGGRVLDGPMDSPFGRVATVADREGASFQIIDTETRTGIPPMQ